MILRASVMLVCLVIPCAAQDAAQKLQDAMQRSRAIPALVDQRNNALDSLALCRGDVQNFMDQLMASRKELEVLKAELAHLKGAPP